MVSEDDTRPRDLAIGDPGSGRARRFGEAEDRPRLVRARLLALLTVLAGAGYLAWVAFARNPDYPIMSGAFFAAEFYALVVFLAACLSVWRLRFKPAGGLPGRGRGLDIDVFVTTAGEPLHLLEPTLRGVAGIEYDGKVSVHVLDDAGSPEVEALTRRFGYAYHSRARQGAGREHAKAGNLNFGLSRTRGDFVLVLDADQVPRPEILSVLASYMEFPDVAFVQSRQYHEVPEGDPFNSQDPVFYEAVQLAFDDENTVISCGSGVLYRRAALEEIGGFVTWNLVEDLTTSYELHSRGWKSFYHPQVLSVGKAPMEILGVYRQRSQWATDALRLFFWRPPLLRRGLSWRGRLNYTLIGLSYILAAIVVPFFFVVPVWSTFTGAAVVIRPYLEFVVVRAVYFFFMVAAVHELFRGRDPGKQFRVHVSLFPAYLWAVLSAVLHPPGRKPRYRVNLAARKAPRAPMRFAAVLPQSVLFVVSAVLPFFAIADGGIAPALIAGNAVVSAFALWSLWPVLSVVSFRQPTAPRTAGIPSEAPAS